MGVPRHNWAAGERITAARLNDTDIQRGQASVSFTSQTSVSINVTFPTAFPTAPMLFCNIASGSGVAGRWGVRAINITSTGFTLFLFTMSTSQAAATWSQIPVQWMAIAP